MLQKVDIAILGAGPAGSAAAIVLARRGYQVALIDKQPFPREKLCGDFVNPINWPLFRELGVEERICSQPHAKVSGFRITTAGGRAAFAQFAFGGQEQGSGLGIRRAHLDQVLLERAAELGVIVRPGRRVDELSRTGPGWVLTAPGEALKAKILIGADGRNSWVAQRLGLNGAGPISGRAIGLQTRLQILRSPVPRSFSLEPPNRTLSRPRDRATVRADGSSARALQPTAGPDSSHTPIPNSNGRAEAGIVACGQVEIHLFPGGYAGTIELGDGTINLCLALDRRIWRRAPSAEYLFGNVLPQNPYLRELLGQSERVARLRSAYPVYFPERCSFSDSVLLVGDAARVSEPVTGEGIYFAMRSGLLAAEVIAEALGRNNLSASFLRLYEQRCHQTFRHRMRLNSLMRFAVYQSVLMDPLIGLFSRRFALLDSLVGAVCAPEPLR